MQYIEHYLQLVEIDQTGLICIETSYPDPRKLQGSSDIQSEMCL